VPRLAHAYRVYGANFDLYRQDVEEMQRRMVAWPEYDRAVEVLSCTLDPMRSQERNKRRALTVKDLLIKVHGSMC